MNRLRRFSAVFLVVLLAFTAGRFSPTLRRPPLVLGQDAAVTGVTAEQVAVSYNPDLGGFIDVAPRGDFSTLFTLYPGGLVRPQAYEWLGRALAPYGVRTLIPVFPLDLAVTAPDRAEGLLGLAAGHPVVIGGHSLGGSMAARFALRHSEALRGLVLMGAYSAEGDDLSGLALETLVLAAEHDGLATLEEITAGMTRLPDGAALSVIPGAVHSFFGRYGPQRGDGLPTVTRAEAERQIVEELSAFFEGRATSKPTLSPVLLALGTRYDGTATGSCISRRRSSSRPVPRSATSP